VSETDWQMEDQQTLPAVEYTVWGVCCDAILLLVTLSVLVLFFIRPDALAALTVIPTECWLLGGCGIQLITLFWWRRPAWWVRTGLWGMFAILFVEPVFSVPRLILSPASESGFDHELRIVSLNCGPAEKNVLAAIREQQPDLVFLQESPGRRRVEEWTRELYGEQGGYVWGPDCSIMARGKVIDLNVPRSASGVAALWQPDGDWSCAVMSLRLHPQHVRFDYWRRSNWLQYREVRERQREQLQTLGKFLDGLPEDVPRIAGGDFNCPAGDSVDRELSRRKMIDPFPFVGRGWGKTISDEVPFHRIDRLWMTPVFPLIEAVSLPSNGSDHRMLRCRVQRPVPAPE